MIWLLLFPLVPVREATWDLDEVSRPKSFGHPGTAGSLQAAWLNLSRFAGALYAEWSRRVL